MTVPVDAVELTAQQAWLAADLVGAGEFPWVLAITQPYGNPQAATKIRDGLRAELAGLGVLGPDGAVHPVLASWLQVVCAAQQSFQTRTARSNGDLLRGVVARKDGTSVVALRAGALVTFTRLDVAHPRTLAAALVAGLPGAPAARFRQFALPTAVGASADERLRAGVPIDTVLSGLDLADEARAALAAMFAGPRSFVEITAEDCQDRGRAAAPLGVGVLDTAFGRVLVSPSLGPDGQWLSTFAPGTEKGIASAVERIAQMLPSGRWFPKERLDVNRWRETDMTERSR